jgi:membrane-anchored protein YejM (alkaline phosphatase superfamily)
MRFFGKILLFIGGVCFIVFAVLGLISLTQGLLANPSAYFASSNAVFAFVVTILWLLLDLFGGYSAIAYAFLSRRWGWVRTLSIVIIVIFIINLVELIIAQVQGQKLDWNAYSSLVYGGTAGLLYVLGFLFCRKGHH